MHVHLESQLQMYTDLIDIEFRNVGYTATGNNGKSVDILKNVNGYLQSGHLTAILGPSGAGKSTLLNVLSGYRTTGSTGTILINGLERKMSQFQKQSCYITQHIAMLSLLTVQETLLCAADLKLGESVTKAKKLDMVNDILELLGLSDTKNTLIHKLSGGEKKRTSICVELLTNPPVMFLDEPTSGLDSSSSFQVISHLKLLAQAGRTVVCSIHQPSSNLLELFDDVLLLAGGQCLYNGPLDQMTNVLLEEDFVCPEYYNRADFAIEVARKQRGNSIEKLVSRFQKEFVPPFSKKHEVSNMKPEELCSMESNSQSETSMDVSNSPSTFYKTMILTKRCLLYARRDWFITPMRLAIHALSGILLGTLCYNSGNEATRAMSNVILIVYILIIVSMISPVLTVLVFPLEMEIILYELQNKWYSLKSYYISKMISDFPMQILCPSVFILSCYYLSDQPFEEMRFLKFWGLCLLLQSGGQYMGHLVGALFKPQMGLFTILWINTFLFLLSGFVVNEEDMPMIFQWLMPLSYLYHTFASCMITIYGDNRRNLRCSKSYCIFKKPTAILEQFGISEYKMEEHIILLTVWAFLMLFSAYFILKYRVKKLSK